MKDQTNLEIKPLYDDFQVKWELKDDQIKPSEKGLLVTIDATHGGFINRNHYYYVPTSMAKAVRSWLEPFPKPVLKNHDKKVDPLGRVKSARYVGDDQFGFIQLDVLITDPDAIQKIMDGRYLTVSTSGTPIEFVRCSICHTDLLHSDEFCGHRRGSVYETEDGVKKVCYWEIGMMDYKEVSFVNIPADAHKEHAAVVTGWKFADAEGEVPINTNDTQEHRGIIVMKSKLWMPQSNEDYQKVAFLIAEGADIIANPSLWDAIQADDPVSHVKAYVKDGGAFSGDIDAADVWVPTDEDLQLLDWLTDQIEVLTDKESKFLSDYAKDENVKRHRHVVHLNEAKNGYTDWILGHHHEVVDGKIQPAKMFDEEGKPIKGHTHNLTEEVFDDSEDMELFDKPMKESTKKRLSKEDPKKFCGPMDPRKGRRTFPVTSCKQARVAMRLLPRYKGPGDKKRIAACIRRRAKEMGCPFKDELEQVYELLSVLEEFV